MDYLYGYRIRYSFRNRCGGSLRNINRNRLSSTLFVFRLTHLRGRPSGGTCRGRAPSPLPLTLLVERDKNGLPRVDVVYHSNSDTHSNYPN